MGTDADPDTRTVPLPKEYSPPVRGSFLLVGFGFERYGR